MADVRSAARQAAEDAVDRERSRMARELHDGIATDLAAAISLFKTHMEAHPGFGKEGGSDEMLGNVFEILERMLKQVRETLAEL
jgi:signal transduction histidine kinase